MSSNVLDGISIPDNLVRDFLFTHDGTAADVLFDTPATFNALALDVFVHNRGAAALTVSLNGGNVVTVDPGDVYTVNDFKFWLIHVASAVIYDCQIFGVRINTLKQRGLMK